MVIHYGSYWLGLSLGIIVGWFLWRRNKTKVGTPSTSTNSQSMPLSKDKPVPREGLTLNEGLWPNKHP